MFIVVSSRFLGGLEPFCFFFLSIFFLLPLLEREKVGNSNGRRTHDSTRTRLSRESAGQIWNTILSFYHSRCETDASHVKLELGKHQLLPILNAYFPKGYRAPGPLRQRSNNSTTSRGGQILFSFTYVWNLPLLAGAELSSRNEVLSVAEILTAHREMS